MIGCYSDIVAVLYGIGKLLAKLVMRTNSLFLRVIFANFSTCQNVVFWGDHKFLVQNVWAHLHKKIFQTLIIQLCSLILLKLKLYIGTTTGPNFWEIQIVAVMKQVLCSNYPERVVGFRPMLKDILQVTQVMAAKVRSKTMW